MDCGERIERLEDEHEKMGDVTHIRAKRVKVREMKRLLDQEIEQLAVRHFFPISHATISNMPVLGVSLG